MDKQFILTILSRCRGKNHKNELLFRGTYEQASDACQENSYPIGYYEIKGYGAPAY